MAYAWIDLMPYRKLDWINDVWSYKRTNISGRASRTAGKFDYGKKIIFGIAYRDSWLLKLNLTLKKSRSQN